MAAPGDAPVVVRSHVDWAAIFAGTAITTAIALILLAFGAGLGLSVTSPYEGENWEPAAYAVAAGLWLLWVQLVSFSAGGYVAGRLRVRTNDATEQEIDVRDGMHGLIVWAAGVIAAAFIAFAGIGGVATAARTADTPADLAAAASSQIAEAADREAAEEGAENPEAAGSTVAERRAEIARKLTVISGFITAAALLAGAVVAFFFAGVGGRHRDENTVVGLFVLRKATKLW